ncbi:MAG: hypothetical protein SPH77_01225 [Campylobacter sp.]|uniref:hypothetical protein n=1 Tax=Campylobacter sp. TaxID=205 RepID=UPI002A553770|nr:hypothetical protein [Campylobacter sp.]MDD7091364.1 hypothetical protein [Campylobacteraceae bacterium]MDY3663567.1 hypothetical protein [Campylobacter sp.]MDY4012831.1 hypothetical protein [Campylobacter sp.]MDY5285986.1 hypothetical protein [Campylobacter sp.]MDY6187441.1 hypothetical protein [Campylobacter sp.]
MEQIDLKSIIGKKRQTKHAPHPNTLTQKKQGCQKKFLFFCSYFLGGGSRKHARTLLSPSLFATI